MNIFGANITQKVSGYFNTKLKNHTAFENANQMLYDDFGIINFFSGNEELNLLKNNEPVFTISDRAEYGDFQTNEDLANNISVYFNLNDTFVILGHEIPNFNP